jgi:GT2 family glycosyltransferase
MTPGRRPRVRANDWSVLEVPDPGAWTPSRSVSIVIPAYRAESTLPYTLAALSAQTYPDELLEVVVVDDGDDTALRLPDVRPTNTRLVRVSSSWGRANACREGATAAEGDVIHWLDADMVPCRDQVERQMRWHHVIDDAVVLGHKMFVDPEGLPPVGEVLEAVENDKLEVLFSGRWADEHAWVEKIWQRTQELTTADFRAFHVHVGATASVGRDLYESAGAMDPALKLGEDIELGYRLAMKGGVFIADRGACSWHLGRTTLMKHEQQVQRYNVPFIAERVPDFRKFRQARGRAYKVPLIEVVVDTAGHTYDDVTFTVNGVLQGTPGDVRCVLLGPWSKLHDDRRHPLEDPLLEHRLVREEYASDCRVEFAEDVAATAFPAQYRLRLPVGWRPGEMTLEVLTTEMQKRCQGLRSIVLPDGQVARFERTAAFERALRLMEDGEDCDDVVDQIAASWWSEGVEDGFEHRLLAPPTSKTCPEDSTEESRPPSDTDQESVSSTGRLRSAVARLGKLSRRDRPSG